MAKPVVELCQIVEKEQLTFVEGEIVFRLVLKAPQIAAGCTFGQFVHVKCGKDAYLRRPISICDAENGLLTLVIGVKGAGTRALFARNVGDVVDILGPLGDGVFTPKAQYAHPVMVGGGIGIFPLYMLAKTYKDESATILGFRSRALITMKEAFAGTGTALAITTDDGSFGHHGFVTDLLKEKIDAGLCDAIFACGPMPMLKGVAALGNAAGIPTQVSLEQRMGCGIGACLTCATPIEMDGVVSQVHVCKYGPVFDAKEVKF